VRFGKIAETWKERTIPRRATSAAGSEVMSSPLNRIAPEVGAMNRVSRLKTVVFPAPFGPMSAWIDPRCTRRSTPATAQNPAKCFLSARASRMTSVSIRGQGSNKHASAKQPPSRRRSLSKPAKFAGARRWTARAERLQLPP
jgi:hypothetical protein